MAANFVENTPLFREVSRSMNEQQKKRLLCALKKVQDSGCPVRWSADNVDRAMLWGSTPQGHEYWEAVQCREYSGL